MPPQDDPQEVFTGALRELLESHVVEDQHVGPQDAGEDVVGAAEGFLFDEVADPVEDGPVEDAVAELEGLVAEGLSRREEGVESSIVNYQG